MDLTLQHARSILAIARAMSGNEFKNIDRIQVEIKDNHTTIGTHNFSSVLMKEFEHNTLGEHTFTIKIDDLCKSKIQEPTRIRLNKDEIIIIDENNKEKYKIERGERFCNFENVAPKDEEPINIFTLESKHIFNIKDTFPQQYEIKMDDYINLWISTHIIDPYSGKLGELYARFFYSGDFDYSINIEIEALKLILKLDLKNFELHSFPSEKNFYYKSVYMKLKSVTKHFDFHCVVFRGVH